MERPKRISNVLFDFDGVIADTEPIGLRLDQAAYARLGVDVGFEDAKRIIGTDGVSVVAEILANNGRPDLTPADFRANRESTDVIYQSLLEAPMPGARETLAYLAERNVAVGLVSTTLAHNLLFALDRLRLLPSFSAIVGGDMVEHRKPAPDPWLAAFGYLGGTPADTIAVDDSPTGIASAKRAGLFTVGFKGGSIEQDTSGADVEVADFAELRELLSEWLDRD